MIIILEFPDEASVDPRDTCQHPTYRRATQPARACNNVHVCRAVGYVVCHVTYMNHDFAQLRIASIDVRRVASQCDR